MNTKSVWDYKVGFQLRLLRLSRNLSQANVATEVGLTLSEFQAVEKGQNRLTTDLLARLNVLYGADIESALGALHNTLSSQQYVANDNKEI